MLSVIHDFYRRIFWDASPATNHYGQGWELHYTGYPFLVGANQLWLNDPKLFNAGMLWEAMRFFRPFKAEWSLLITPALQPNLLEKALNFGGSVRWSSPMMVCEGPPRFESPTHIPSLYQVDTPELYRSARRVIGDAFDMEEHISPLMMRDDGSGILRHLLACWRSQPVAVGTTNLSGNIAGIWNVGTRRQFRRQGFASTIMMALWMSAQESGAAASLLLASLEGRPLYEKLGYSHVAEVYYVGFPWV